MSGHTYTAYSPFDSSRYLVNLDKCMTYVGTVSVLIKRIQILPFLCMAVNNICSTVPPSKAITHSSLLVWTRRYHLHFILHAKSLGREFICNCVQLINAHEMQYKCIILCLLIYQTPSALRTHKRILR